MKLGRQFVLALPAALLLALPASAMAGNMLKGKVSGGKNYTLLVLGTDGTATTKKLGSSGKFQVKLPKGSSAVTLQLLKPTGTYFGPVVLAKKKSTAYLGLKTGTDLGTIKLKSGFAATTKSVAKAKLSTRITAAISSSGKPVGAGKLGVVKRSGSASAVTAATFGNGFGDNGAGQDTDTDGLPDAIDADDNGNLLLDGVDPATASTPASNSGLFSDLRVDMQSALNANATGISATQVSDFITQNLGMVFYFSTEPSLRTESGSTVDSADVDCLTLPYCTRGGGTAIISGVTESSASLPRGSLWTSYSPNGSGLPNLELINNDGQAAWAMGIQPHASTGQIQPGDTFQVQFRASSGVWVVPTTLATYFASVPALKSYEAGGGAVELTYPSPSASTITLPSGTNNLALTFWRPQRMPIPGVDSGTFVDAGHLHYGLTVQTNTQEFGCASDYSGLSSTLTNEPPASSDPSSSLFTLLDSADDGSPDAANTLSFTTDLRSCLSRNGVTPTPGSPITVALIGTGEPRTGGVDRAGIQFQVDLQ